MYQEQIYQQIATAYRQARLSESQLERLLAQAAGRGPTLKDKVLSSSGDFLIALGARLKAQGERHQQAPGVEVPQGA